LPLHDCTAENIFRSVIFDKKDIFIKAVICFLFLPVAIFKAKQPKGHRNQNQQNSALIGDALNFLTQESR
jgi:hypothetical protein